MDEVRAARKWNSPNIRTRVTDTAISYSNGMKMGEKRLSSSCFSCPRSGDDVGEKKETCRRRASIPTPVIPERDNVRCIHLTLKC